MFAVAIILAATAVGWPKISPHVPEIDDWISNVTDSRLTWFVIGIVLGLVTGFAIGAWLDARLKRRADRAHSDSGSRVPDQTAAPVSDPITDIRTARKLVTEFPREWESEGRPDCGYSRQGWIIR
jgi:HAMP domain-containing protein